MDTLHKATKVEQVKLVNICGVSWWTLLVTA